MKTKALKIKVHGRVQGVGFRYSTIQAATRVGVSGWVRNEWDGTVLIHCEGESTSVDSFVRWCRKGPSMAYVTTLDISTATYQGVYNGVNVDY